MATLCWLGVAQDLPQIDDHTFANTYAANDTVEVEINKKTLILTLGTDITLADVAAETAAMINAANATAGKLNALDETRNFGGREIPEFTEITASASGAVLRTISTAGVPVTITVAVTTAGSGSVSSSNIQTATGKNFFNNADNWSGGTVPSAGDTILFDQGSVDVKYALDNATERLSLVRRNGYSGNIGLLPTNSLGYVEYRQRFLDLPATGSSGNQAHKFGEFGSTITAAGWTQVNFGTANGTSLTVDIYDAPANSSIVGEAIKINGGVEIVLKLWKGSASVGNDPTASASTLVGSLQGFVNTQASDSFLRIGSNASFVSGHEFEQHGGVSYLSAVPEILRVKGGTCYWLESYPDEVFVHRDGTLVARGSGGLSDIILYNGSTFNVYSLGTFSADTVTQHTGATINDPFNQLNIAGGITTSPI